MKRLITSLLLFLAFVRVQAQDGNVTHWNYRLSNEKAQPGEQVDLIFTASIDKEWYLYSSDIDPDLGPVATNFQFDANETFELVGEVQPVEAKRKYDKTWKGDVTYFVKKAEFRQTIKVLKVSPVIAGQVQGQVCSERKGQCLPFIEPFRFGE